MATYVTSFVCTEHTIPNRWVRVHARTVAMVAIANPFCACSLVLNPPASSPYTNLAALVRRHSAGNPEIIRNAQDLFIPQGRSVLRCIRKRVASPQCDKESALLH